jgi:glycosyltransferase involved in cell wall biosynthesis
MRICAVVPSYNHVAAIAAVIGRLRAASLPVFVIDDGSAPPAATALAALRAPGVVVQRLDANQGKGGAVMAGFALALAGGFSHAVQVDADGQHDPTYVKALLDGLRTADIVVGARFAGTGDYRVRGPRRWAMRLLAFALTRLAHTRMTDVTSGFRAANRRAIGVFADHYPAEYLGDTVESLVIALRSGCTVTQVPVNMRVRTGGRASQTSLKASLYLLRAVVALGLALVRRWPSTLESRAEET